MKNLLALSVAIFAAVAVTASTATEQKKPSKPAPKAALETAKPAPTTLTGSYIPRQVRQDGRITDGPNNVQIISAKSIQLTGAGTLPRALGILGANR